MKDLTFFILHLIAFFVFYLITMDDPVYKWNIKFLGYLTKSLGDYYVIYYVFMKASKRLDDKETHKRRMMYLNFSFFTGLLINVILVAGM